MLNGHRKSAVLILVISFPLTGRAQDSKVSCATCHTQENDALAGSVHAAIHCRQCHGGDESYVVPADVLRRLVARSAESSRAFDHGPTYRGKPARVDVPSLCGDCHAEVERMNPTGLRTDQLVRYWTSGHGKTLTEKGDDRVAVCIDCHGVHDILPERDPASRTHPLNVPDACAVCHADVELMADFDLPVEVVEEYRQSVHGKLLIEQRDTGAPTCATCHGNHSAMPPGFGTVGAVCGKCHQHAASNFSESIHAGQTAHKGCVQCHGGGEGRHFHLIERITKPTGVLLQRYAHLLNTEPSPTPERITEAIHPDPKQIITRALISCTDCHDEIDEDESLPKLFELLDAIAQAERYYVKTAARLNLISKGVLLVDRQRFLFEDAKTHLIGLAPLQHTLNNEKVGAKVADLNAVCDKVNTELDELEDGLYLRRTALIPIWIIAVVFASALYLKFKQLKTDWVKPLPDR